MNQYLTIEIKLKNMDCDFAIYFECIEVLDENEKFLIKHRKNMKLIKRIESKKIKLTKDDNKTFNLGELFKTQNLSRELSLIVINTDIPNFSCDLTHNDIKNLNVSYNVNKIKSHMSIINNYPHMKNKINDTYIWDPMNNLSNLFISQPTSNQNINKTNITIHNDIIDENEMTISCIFYDVVVYDMVDEIPEPENIVVLTYTSPGNSNNVKQKNPTF